MDLDATTSARAAARSGSRGSDVSVSGVTDVAVPVCVRRVPVMGEVVQTLVAGTIAGVAGIVAGQPLDTLKVRMQTNPALKGPLDAARAVMTAHGFRGLYKGMLPPILANAPINALLFAVEHRSASWLEAEASSWSPTARHLVAGGISGLSQCVLSCPSELVKIQMQVQGKGGAFSGPAAATRAIWEHSGLRGLYRGWWITVARDTPAFAVYFWSYSECKAWFMRRAMARRRSEALQLGNPAPTTPLRDVDLGAFPLLMSGGVAGLLSWLLLHPVDVCKSLYQSVPHNRPVKFSAVLKKQMDSQGPKFLLRGIIPTCLRAFPASAVIFLVYEWCLAMWPTVLEDDRTNSNWQ